MAGTLPPYSFNYVDRMLALLVSMFQQPNIQAMVTISAEEMQEAEDSFYHLIVENYVDTAVGRQLDVWGIIVGEPRNGLTDGEYRGFINARILTNLSETTIDELTAILAVIGRAVPDVPVVYHPLYPAAMYFSLVTDAIISGDTADRIKAQMLEATAAGVDIAFIQVAEPGFFGFDLDPDALGFDEGKFGGTL